MRKLWVVTGLLGLSLAVTAPAAAQARFGAGLSWGSDTDFGLDARLNFGLGDISKRSPIEGMVTFDYFFPNGFDYWELTGNGLYSIPTKSNNAKPSIGAGLGIGHTSGYSSPGINGKTNLFLNLVGDLRFKAAQRVLPYVEARVELGEGSQLVLGGGVYFGKP